MLCHTPLWLSLVYLHQSNWTNFSSIPCPYSNNQDPAFQSQIRWVCKVFESNHVQVNYILEWKMNYIVAHMYIIWAFEYSPVFKIKYRSTCAHLSYHLRSEADVDYSLFQCFLEEWQVCIIAMPKRFFYNNHYWTRMNYLFRVVVGSLCAYLAKKIDRAEIIRKL